MGGDDFEIGSDLGGSFGSTPSPRTAVRRPVQLSGEIARYLREQIMLGRYIQGDQLNIERLARETDTSTTPVREALLALRSEGFVELEPRKGFRVAPLLRGDVEDIALLLRTVAGELAARAAIHLSQEEIGRLHSLDDLMRRAHAHGATEEIEALDFKFHRLINQASQSAKLKWMISILVRYFPAGSYSLVPGWMDASVEHGPILEALAGHDVAAARKATARHLETAANLLITHLLHVIPGFGESGGDAPKKKSRLLLDLE
jgi:DNA-binding GntR family transcriptional regulator